jgi:sugar lactone lactonase YvrE
MITPNALTFDSQGNLYATDSSDGTIWRFPRGGRGALWLRNDLLAGFPEGPIGANGIAFVPPASLYVANTNFGWIVRIPIDRNGRAGRATVVAVGPELLIVDGLAADVHGGLHAVIVGASIFGTAPVVHVDPRTGAITSSTDEWGQFDFPTSLAFGAGPLDHKSVYVVNGGLFPEDRPEAAPGIVRVGVDVPGSPTH